MNYPVAISVVSALTATVIAVAVGWRERRSASFLAFAAGMLLFAVESVVVALSASEPQLEAVLDWQRIRLVLFSLMPGLWVFFSFTYARGNHKEFVARWRWVILVAFVLPPVLACSFFSQIVSGVLVLPDHEWLFQLSLPGRALYLVFLLCAVLVMMNLERTFRTSVGTMRWRIKFMILGLGLLFAVRAYTNSDVLLFGGISSRLLTVNVVALFGSCLLMVRSLLRSGHFEVSVYPSHAVLHRSLTGLLTGAYLVIVGVFAVKVSHTGGDASFTLKAFFVLMALVGMTVVMLSDRVRFHTRRFVSRHFQRPLYDYRTVWRTFTHGIGSQPNEMELCRAAVRLVSDTFQVLSVTAWLVDDQEVKLSFAASTSISESKGVDLGPPTAEAIEVLRALRLHPDPIEIGLSKENWARALQRCHPDVFHGTGSRVCVPMIVGGHLVGLITLGDRVGGGAFSLQDFDLLRCVGDQVAAGLLNVQLAKKLLQAKEMEAFQTMSTFFVHDLKNTASTLNLMLRNLPVHFDDPSFRADALRGIGKTVEHINHLIERLSLLRHGLKIQVQPGDLNEAVARVCSAWKASPSISLVKELRPLPPVLVDQEQLHKVLLNLVLNADEAMSGKGEVRIETGQRDGWAFISVSDNGPGMEAEFIRRSLFKPFQSTKKRGLGIGLFQSKMIVEAHGGKLEVESVPGKGATFRVMLPGEKSNK